MLGARRLLNASLAPWLCYYCGDCSTTCPRQTEPGEAMMTLRRYLTGQYDWTGISSRIYRSKVWKVGLLLATALITLGLIIFYHTSVVGMPLSDFTSTSMGLGHMFGTISVFTWVVIFLPLFFLMSNGVRMFFITMRNDETVKIPAKLYLTEIGSFFSHLLAQRKFRECKEKGRWIKHLFFVSGCSIMFILLVFFLKWFQTDNLYPLYHPQRWIGYIATIALLYASIEVLLGRIRKKDPIHRFSDVADWSFPILLLLVTLSGIAVHIFRYSGFAMAMHISYALHIIVTVPLLVIEIPFGKWTHMLYRPLAVYFQTIKDKAFTLQSQEEEISENAA
jgi:hypothetical protein